MFSETNHNLVRFARSSIDHDATVFKVAHHNCPAGKATFWMFHSVQNRCHLWSLGSTIVSIQWRTKRGIGENTQKIMQQRTKIKNKIYAIHCGAYHRPSWSVTKWPSRCSDTFWKCYEAGASAQAGHRQQPWPGHFEPSLEVEIQYSLPGFTRLVASLPSQLQGSSSLNWTRSRWGEGTIKGGLGDDFLGEELVWQVRGRHGDVGL